MVRLKMLPASQTNDCRPTALRRTWLVAFALAAAWLAACSQDSNGFAARAGKTLTLGDGSTITHPWDEAGPLPAANDWVKVEVAGYLLAENRERPGHNWTWTFTLALLAPDISLVVVSDVTDATATRLVGPGQGIFNNGKWLAQSDELPVSGFHLPWLYRDGDSVRILRFSIANKDGQTRILFQPVLFTHEGKKSLLSIAREPGDGAAGI